MSDDEAIQPPADQEGSELLTISEYIYIDRGLDEDGDLTVAVRWDRGMNYTVALGMLEFAKQQLIDSYHRRNHSD